MNLDPKDAELIVGIVTRIGVDTKSIVKEIRLELEQYAYTVYEIHVTDVLQAFKAQLNIVSSPAEERYNSYTTACNKLRKDLGNAVMAEFSIMEIAGRRVTDGLVAREQSRNAFIVNQIKRPEESETLRKVYGEHYVQISCHADEQVRIESLTSRISEDHPEDPKSSAWDLKARGLVHTDESQEDEKHGQRVRQVFPLSDVIINANSDGKSIHDLERFFRALFGDKAVTPTREEYGMELANTAAQRSSDLSRQVGAAILTTTSEVRALGCNEVPRARGGTYWEGEGADGRDFALGRDINEQRRRAVLLDLMLRLGRAKALIPGLVTHQEIEKFLFEREDKLISDSQLMDSLEYGRSVHAEMNAITDAARCGIRISDCILFSNTFPCHNCAKHIVASGIAEVIYNHPYPKSYARELFADSITINPTNIDPEKVTFRQFIGDVGPMYARLFTKARWKRDGGIVERFKKGDASYIRRTPVPAYPQTEELIIHGLSGKLDVSGYRSPAVLPEATNTVAKARVRKAGTQKA